MSQHIRDKMKGGLTATQQLAAVLRFLGEGSYQHGTGKDYDVAIAQPTFSVVLDEVLEVMERVLCPKWINLDMSVEEKRRAMRYFYEKSNIPGIVMCIDGSHVKIIPPKDNKEHFYNRKGFYSLNVLLVGPRK